MTTEDTPTTLVPAATGAKIDQFFKAGLQRRQAQEVQDPQAFRLGIARRRYREGFTDRESFIDELRALQGPADQIDLEVIAGDLEASYDYTMDLIAVWRDAFRKGHISIATFAERIASVVVVPERSQTYVARELAKLKPEEAPTLAPVPKAYYETDAGRIEVDTIRRLRRKDILDRPTEIRELRDLGMPEDQATAIAENDDARLREKAE